MAELKVRPIKMQDETHANLKRYARQRGLTMGEALQELIKNTLQQRVEEAEEALRGFLSDEGRRELETLGISEEEVQPLVARLRNGLEELKRLMKKFRVKTSYPAVYECDRGDRRGE